MWPVISRMGHSILLESDGFPRVHKIYRCNNKHDGYPRGTTSEPEPTLQRPGCSFQDVAELALGPCQICVGFGGADVAAVGIEGNRSRGATIRCTCDRGLAGRVAAKCSFKHDEETPPGVVGCCIGVHAVIIDSPAGCRVDVAGSRHILPELVFGTDKTVPRSEEGPTNQ